MALVAGLSPSFATTGAALVAIELALAVSRRRLGRVVRIKGDAPLLDRNLRLQFVQQRGPRTGQLCLRLDDGVALDERARQLRLIRKAAGVDAARLVLHGP